ncbi:hypothetical protein K9M74_03260 [Candidatus Woesearchaeota archaeon]|nr:hypothetical protein [Candidatus Woesearchaeota archaeon]MCF7859160.1 hypothetical protein [Candidatus Cloacimonadota bacterium]MCF8012819.1 hypothetical protein [Candidatus Woesearchaeota archaeon]
MSKINEETRNRIKEQIIKCITYNPKSAREIAMSINRSWNLTSKLLTEIEEEYSNVKSTKVGTIKAYAIK